MTNAIFELKPLDPLPWPRKNFVSRYNPDPNCSPGEDPNIECHEPLFGWIRPDRGKHPDSHRVAEYVERLKKLAQLAQKIRGEIDASGQRIIALAMLLQEARAEFDRVNGGAKAWQQRAQPTLGLQFLK